MKPRAQVSFGEWVHPTTLVTQKRWLVDGQPLFITTKHEVEYGYVDPGGEFPDGYYVPVTRLQRLLDAGAIVLHHRDDSTDATDGYGFQIAGRAESREAQAHAALVEME